MDIAEGLARVPGVGVGWGSGLSGSRSGQEGCPGLDEVRDSG